MGAFTCFVFVGVFCLCGSVIVVVVCAFIIIALMFAIVANIYCECVGGVLSADNCAICYVVVIDQVTWISNKT